jgi:hypothetical protein
MTDQQAGATCRRRDLPFMLGRGQPGLSQPPRPHDSRPGPTFAQQVLTAARCSTLQLEALFLLVPNTVVLPHASEQFHPVHGDTTGAGMHSDLLSGWDESCS